MICIDLYATCMSLIPRSSNAAMTSESYFLANDGSEGVQSSRASEVLLDQ